nr:tRNA (guanosine(46)-N7)-methyltransferase TrmB [bacterium]
PSCIEIGMGKGRFIIEMALNNPNLNFIGIEKYSSVILQATKKLEILDIPNLRLLNMDASNLLDIFYEGSISLIYLNFSDPWPKKRQAKRRLTHENFLQIYDKLLTKDGEIHFKTDNRGLFEFSLESFNNYGFKLKRVNLDLHNSELDFVNVETEFEEKYGANSPIYRLEAYR